MKSQVQKGTVLTMGAAAGAAVVAAYWYAHQVERTNVSLYKATISIDKPGLPPAGITILQLSDFHFRADDAVQEKRLERLRSLLAQERYDVLAVTGDLIHNEAGLPRALAFLSELRPALAAFWVPGNRDYWESSFRAVLGTPEEQKGLNAAGRVRLVLGKVRRMLGRFVGNERAALHLHENDVEAMNEALQAQDIEPLINRAVNLRSSEYDLWFAGVDDLTQGQPDLPGALAAVPAHAPLVLLAHNPDIWLARDAASQSENENKLAKPDLVLSGHTHGGQLNLPVIGAWYRQGTRVSRHKAAGWFEDGSSRLFVSRGLGESFPFRVGAPPQAALIHLTPLRAS